MDNESQRSRATQSGRREAQRKVKLEERESTQLTGKVSTDREKEMSSSDLTDIYFMWEKQNAVWLIK